MDQRENLVVKLRVSSSDGQSREVALTPDQYFDPEYRGGNDYDVEDTARHQDLYKYVPGEVVQLAELEISDPGKQCVLKIRASYWDGHESECVEKSVSREDTGVSYEETIISQRITEPIPGWFILRLERRDSFLIPVSRSFVQQNQDGTQTDFPL